MANEKRLDLIDRKALGIGYCNPLVFDKIEYAHGWNCAIEILMKAPTVDAVEVVFCDECENYGKCYPETIFRLARIEKPFCCVGKRKTNTNFGAKMDGDGNG